MSSNGGLSHNEIEDEMDEQSFEDENISTKDAKAKIHAMLKMRELEVTSNHVLITMVNTLI